MSLRGWTGVAHYGLPGLLLGLALSWWGGGRGVSAQAQPLPGAERAKTAVMSATESGGTIAFTSSTTGSAQLLYLIDTRIRAFAIYRVDPSNPKGTVKLEAARQYNWDLKLTAYNNQEPEVTAIESMVKTLGHPTR
jgi:hypothetical protein